MSTYLHIANLCGSMEKYWWWLCCCCHCSLRFAVLTSLPIWNDTKTFSLNLNETYKAVRMHYSLVLALTFIAVRNFYNVFFLLSVHFCFISLLQNVTFTDDGWSWNVDFPFPWIFSCAILTPSSQRARRGTILTVVWHSLHAFYHTHIWWHSPFFSRHKIQWVLQMNV